MNTHILIKLIYLWMLLLQINMALFVELHQLIRPAILHQGNVRLLEENLLLSLVEALFGLYIVVFALLFRPLETSEALTQELTHLVDGSRRLWLNTIQLCYRHPILSERRTVC